VRTAGGHLYLSGIRPEARHHLTNGGTFRDAGPFRAYDATAVIGESTTRATRDAQEWLFTGPGE
jgi:hypothetical protein